MEDIVYWYNGQLLFELNIERHYKDDRADHSEHPENRVEAAGVGEMKFGIFPLSLLLKDIGIVHFLGEDLKHMRFRLFIREGAFLLESLKCILSMLD